jgi:hypothetical protein
MQRDLRVVAIVAAYNEEDIIGQTVGDLIDQGIQVYLLDHRSTDGTVNAIERHLGRGLLQIERFPDDCPSDSETPGNFALASIIARKEQLAGDLDADWFINHDADEFRESPWSHLNLRQAIALVDRLGYNAIDFELLNFWPTHDSFGQGEDVRDTFRHYEFGAHWDRLQIRCWKKTSGPLALAASAGHEAVFEGRRVFPIRFILRHYPIRGQAHGVRKVFRERRSRFAPEERERGWHVQYDGLTEEHSFVRDPSTLRAYDPEEIRVHVQLHHRGVEEIDLLRERLGRMEARTTELQAEIEFHRELVRSEVDRNAQLTRDRTRLEDDVRQRAAALIEQHEQTARLQSRLDEQSRMEHELRARVSDLEKQLAGMYASRSWRVTAPLRAAQRLVTGR